MSAMEIPSGDPKFREFICRCRPDTIRQPAHWSIAALVCPFCCDPYIDPVIPDLARRFR